MPRTSCAQVIPIPFSGLFQLFKPFIGHKNIVCLPKLGHDEFSDQGFGHGPTGELIEIPDVARFVALIGGANFLGKNFSRYANRVSRSV